MKLKKNSQKYKQQHQLNQKQTNERKTKKIKHTNPINYSNKTSPTENSCKRNSYYSKFQKSKFTFKKEFKRIKLEYLFIFCIKFTNF